MFSAYWKHMNSSLFTYITILQLLCNMDSLGERTQLVITLFQFILVIALGYDTTTRLEPELTITTDKGTDNDGLIEVTIQSNESDATAISTSVVRLQL